MHNCEVPAEYCAAQTGHAQVPPAVVAVLALLTFLVVYSFYRSM